MGDQLDFGLRRNRGLLSHLCKMVQYDISPWNSVLNGFRFPDREDE